MRNLLDEQAELLTRLAFSDTPCRGKTSLFYSQARYDDMQYNPTHELCVRLAKKLCLTQCPALEDCRRYARLKKEPFGIWGGETPEERGIKRTLRSPLLKVRKTKKTTLTLVPYTHSTELMLLKDAQWPF